MKIALITPFPPYRGGIAKHSENLYKELASIVDIKVYNFKRQYPNFLFPGKTQYQDKDISSLYNSERTIDTLNPFTWRLTAESIIDNKFDKVIFRYWHPFFIPCYISIIKYLKKNQNSIRIFSICDNIIPHESFILQNNLIKQYISKLDGLIVMSENVKEELIKINSKCNYIKLFLPIINDQKPTYNQSNARNKIGLNLNKTVFLFFGLIRPYKGIDILLEAVNNISSELVADFQLLIVGEAYENINKYKKITKNNISCNIKWITKYVPEEDINLYFSACDYVVIPYKTASQSAIIPMAYNFGKPVIVSDIKGLSEFVINNKTGFTFSASKIENLTNVLNNAIKCNGELFIPNINQMKDNISTSNFVKKIIDFIK